MSLSRSPSHDRTIREHRAFAPRKSSHVFRFPPDARWNPEHAAVEFSIGVGEYEGVVRIPRRVFQTLLDQSPTPERCLEAYYLQRTRVELIAERKVRRRQLTEDGNVEISGRDCASVNHDPFRVLTTATGGHPGKRCFQSI
jgi:hypothetical protein